MSHKIDRGRHRAKCKVELRTLKHRYVVLTKNNTLTPENFEREVQKPEAREQVLKICRRLARRQAYMPLYPLVQNKP